METGEQVGREGHVMGMVGKRSLLGSQVTGTGGKV